MVLIARHYGHIVRYAAQHCKLIVTEDSKMAVEVEKATQTLLYKRETAAARLGISLRTLDELLATKKLRSVKIRKRRLISEEAIQSFIRQAEKF